MRPLLTLSLTLLLAGCDLGFDDPSREFAEPPIAGPEHPVTIHQPATLGVLDTDRLDVNGQPIGIACATCHGVGADADAVAQDLGNPEKMHGTVELKHAELSCDACHDAQRDKLHLADGTQLDMAQAMDLCGQCHGPQKRDYDGGSHGGMAGYWDLTRGPRTRNHCLDCHDAHDPAFVGGAPVHPPRDRFLNPGEAHHD